MFEQSTIASATGNSRAFSAGLGIAGQAIFVGAIVLGPLIWPQILPKPQSLALLLPPPVPVAPHVKAAVVKPKSAPAPYKLFQVSTLLTPSHVPDKVAIIEDPPPDVGLAVEGGSFSGAGSVGVGTLDGILRVQPPPPVESKPPEPKIVTKEPKRIKVGGAVQLARLIKQVQPVYPPIARQTRVSGTVELTGTIGTDGHIRELKPLSGNPLLIRAAMEAVSQWIYEPTLLNGEPVEVIAPITVTFHLN